MHLSEWGVGMPSEEDGWEGLEHVRCRKGADRVVWVQIVVRLTYYVKTLTFVSFGSIFVESTLLLFGMDSIEDGILTT